MMKKSFLMLVILLSLFSISELTPVIYASPDEWTTPSSVYDKCGEHASYPATKSIDEDTASYWRHEIDCTHWIIFDMGQSEQITKIRIYQSNVASRRWGASSGLKVWVSDNPSDWGSVVWEGVLDATGWQESGSFDKTGRYIKLESKYGFGTERMYEFDAYVTVGGVEHVVDLTHSISNSWSLQTETDYKLVSSYSVLTSWQVLTESSFSVDLSYGLSMSWLVVTEWTALVSISLAVVLSWLLEVTKTSGALFTVDLLWSLSQSWSILTQSTFNIVESWGITQAWTVLTTSTFNLVTSLSHSLSWTLEVVVGAMHFVELTWSQTMQWVVDVVYSVGVLPPEVIVSALEMIIMFCTAWFFSIINFIRRKFSIFFGAIAMGCWFVLALLWLFFQPLSYFVAFIFMIFGFLFLLLCIVTYFKKLQVDRYGESDLD